MHLARLYGGFWTIFFLLSVQVALKKKKKKNKQECFEGYLFKHYQVDAHQYYMNIEIHGQVKASIIMVHTCDMNIIMTFLTITDLQLYHGRHKYIWGLGRQALPPTGQKED